MTEGTQESAGANKPGRGSANRQRSQMAAQFAKMRAGFEAATQRCPSATTSNNYEIAGLQVCVRVAGQELAQDLRLAFSHLETDELQCPPDLLIEVWNECETGTPDPSPDRGRHGDEPFYVIEPSPDGRFILDSRNHSSCWLDRRSGHIVASLESAGTQFLDERARPFRRLLSIWLNDRGIQLSHCGLVALHGDGLLFVGNQGVGKSTSALACLQGGFDFLSDDFVALAANGERGIHRP